MPLQKAALARTPPTYSSPIQKMTVKVMAAMGATEAEMAAEAAEMAEAAAAAAAEAVRQTLSRSRKK